MIIYFDMEWNVQASVSRPRPGGRQGGKVAMLILYPDTNLPVLQTAADSNDTEYSPVYQVSLVDYEQDPGQMGVLKSFLEDESWVCAPHGISLLPFPSFPSLL